MSRSASFETRVEGIARNHARLKENGAVSVVDATGLVTLLPRRRRRHVSPRPFVMALVAAMAGKAALLGALGPDTYAAKVEALRQGSTIERAGAWIMQPDPVTAAIAASLERFR